MSFLNYFRESKPASATMAKERLQIIVAHERKALRTLDFLPEMQREILDIVRKYVGVETNDVSINIEDENDCSILELNITLPE